MIFVCIASGPSLTREDVDQVRHLETIAVSDNYRIAPWAQHVYAADPEWWDHHHADAKATGAKCWAQCQVTADRYGLTRIEGVHEQGLGKDLLHFGANSGSQVINLAYLLGAKTIVLLGYDCKSSGPKHWFGDHPGFMNRTHPYELWIERFGILAHDLAREGIEVINCTRDTALTCFPSMTIEEFLCTH